MGCHHPHIRRALLFGTAAAAAVWWSPALAPILPGIASALGVSRCTPRPGAVAVAFDDGPHPEGAPAVLAERGRGGATATFFLCGEQVERDPGRAREIRAAGHSVALHGHRHRNVLRLPPRTFVEDLERGIAAVEDAVGIRPVLFRPPY